MKKVTIKVVIFLTIATASIYLYHRHQQALIDQQETPTDSDCCAPDLCDSIAVKDSIIKK